MLDVVLPRHGGTRDERGVAVLTGARVYDAGIVLTPDGATVIRDLTRNFGYRGDGRHWLQNYRWMGPPTPVAGRTAVVAVNLGKGYAHWLLEEFPRWLSLRDDDAENVIAHDRAPFIGEVCALAGFKQRVVPATRHGHWVCETLVIPPVVEMGSARVVGTLNDFARGVGVPVTGGGDKLYITRENASRRRVSNEGELWPRLSERGFVKLRLETMTWREQVAAFASARVVVAPHGAGLANVVFCRAGTRVVEFFNRSYVNPCFEEWARAARLDYCAVVEESDQPITCDRAAGKVDIHADVERILREATAEA
jgi:capsular polysaccharide biosynthesis protein